MQLLAGGGGEEEGVHTTKVTRRVVRGPCLYFPKVGDTLEQFKWLSKLESKEPNSGASSNATRHKNEYSSNTKNIILPLFPLQWEFLINLQVLGYDFGKVKLGVRYQIKDVNLLLDHATDPLQAMENAVMADIQYLAAIITERAQQQQQEQPPPPPPPTQQQEQQEQQNGEQSTDHEQQQNQQQSLSTTGVLLDTDGHPPPVATPQQQRAQLQPPNFCELLEVLESMLADTQSPLHTALSTLTVYRDMLVCAESMGIEVTQIAFLSLLPSSKVTEQRETLARGLASAQHAHMLATRIRNERALAEEGKTEAYESELRESRQRLLAKREQQEAAQSLESSQCAHETMMLEGKHRSKLQQKRETHDELLRVLQQVHHTSESVDLTTLALSFFGGHRKTNNDGDDDDEDDDDADANINNNRNKKKEKKHKK